MLIIPIIYIFLDVIVKVDKANPWVLLIVTPLNQKVQKLQSSSEIIFPDTSSSCDVSMASVNVIVSATKGGAVPISNWCINNK